MREPTRVRGRRDASGARETNGYFGGVRWSPGGRPRVWPGRIALAALLAVGGVALNLALAPAAHAAPSTFTVTDCSNANGSVGTLNLDTALADAQQPGESGDTINFSCDGTIALDTTLTITSTLTIDGTNHTVAVDGGAPTATRQDLVVQSGANLTLTNLTIQNGTAAANGGGIENDGTLKLTNSTVANNSANSAGQGGGIWTSGGGMLTVNNSTVANNSAGAGGGIYIAGGPVTITNSTVAGNSANSGLLALGGGIANTSGALTISNSTVANNSVTAGSGSGGGIANPGGIVNSSGNIVAGNTAPTGANCSGPIADLGYNLEFGTDCFFNAPGSLSGTNPQLAASLANNGGPTQTLALQATSPAIDHIPAASCPATDQRGVTRPDGGEASCDIGAYEFVDKADTTTTITSETPDPSVVGQQVTVSFSVTVNPPGTGTPTGTVTVSNGTDSCAATVAVGQCTIIFSGAGSASLSAAYPGDSNFNGGASAAVAHQVNKADTTTTITANTPNPSSTGQAVTVNFSVTANAPGGGTPTGNVTVTDGVDSCTGTVGAGTCGITLSTLGTRTLTATYAGDGNYNGGTSAGVSQNVGQAPAITTQPAAQTANVGGNASFTAAASGTPPPTVQWQVSTDGGGTWNNLSGATSATLSLTGVTAGMDGYQYRAVFTNSVGSATSSAATLTVNSAPTILFSPTNQTASAGGTVSFTAGASGTPPPIAQWQVSTDGGGTWNNLTDGGGVSGSATPVLTLTGVTAGMDGYQYRAVFTNTVGSATSSAATLTVNFAPAIVTQPVPQVVNAGGTASFTAAASGTPAPMAQWQVSTDGGATWTNLTDGSGVHGSTTSTLTLIGVTAGMDQNQYRAVFTNLLGTATSFPAILNVNSAPTVTTNPTNQTVSAGGTATFTAAASGTPPPTVQWQVSTDGGGTWNNLSGATSATLSLTGVTASMDGYQYRAVFTNAAGSATSSAATLTVQFAPTITSLASTTFVVGRSGSFTVTTSGFPTPTLSATGSLPGGVSMLFNNTNGTASLFGTPNVGTGGDYTLNFTATNGIGTPATQTFTLVVLEPPVIGSPNATTFTVGTSGSFTVLTGGFPTPSLSDGGATLPTGVTFVDNGDGTATLSGTPAVGTGGTYTFTITAQSVIQPATQTFTLTVDEAPAVTTQPAAQTAHAGGTATFTAAARGTPPPTAQWQVSTDGGGTWTNLSDGSGVSGSATPSLTLTGVTAGMDGNQYRAVFTNPLGTATSSAATLTVQFAPRVTIGPRSQTVNAGDTATFTASGFSNPTPTAQWQASTDGGATWNNLSGGTVTGGGGNSFTATLTITNVPAITGVQFRAVFTNTVGSATSSAATLTVLFAPTVGNNPTNLTVNAGDTATFTASGFSNPTPTAQWQASTDGGTTWNNASGGTGITGRGTVFSTTLTLTNVTATMNGDLFRVVVTNGSGSATSTAATLTVNQPTTTTVSSSANPSVFGQSVTFTATVAPATGTGTPSGTIQFNVDGTAFGSPVALDSSGKAQSGSISTLTVGTHTVTADYTPATGTTFMASSGTLAGGQMVNKDTTTTTLASVTSPVAYAQSVTFTATVAVSTPGAGTPTGTVTFYDGTNPIGTGTLNGGNPDQATFTTSALGVGNHSITATYNGDGNSSGSSSGAVKFLVQATTTTLYTGTQLVIIPGQVAPSAQIGSLAAACANTGSVTAVTFTLDLNPITGAAGPYSLGSVAVSGGVATAPTVATTNWQEGVYTVTATYSATAIPGCLGSFDTATLTVGGTGDSANGGGWTTVPKIGRVNFGFTVQKIPNTNPAQYKGQFTMINNGNWRLKGTLSSYTKTANNQAGIGGTGDLYWWNPALNGGLGDWQLYQSGVAFTVSVTDNGNNLKTNPDLYGQHINATAGSGYPTMPNFAPQAIKGGNITVR